MAQFIVQGGALPKRDIVDTKTHTSCRRTTTCTNKPLLLLYGRAHIGLAADEYCTLFWENLDGLLNGCSNVMLNIIFYIVL